MVGQIYEIDQVPNISKKLPSAVRKMVITYFLFFTIYSTDWLKNGKKTKNPSAPLQQPQWPFLTKNIFEQLDLIIIPNTICTYLTVK